MLLLSVSVYSQSEEMLREWKETTWRLNIMLKSQIVHGGAVQFAVKENDPRESFKKDYEKLKEKMHKDSRYSPESETAILSVAWDKQFGDVKGDEIYILFKNDMCGFSSNTESRKLYLVTKTAFVNEKPAVWVIPVDVKIGAEQDITLDDSNVVYLDKIAE